MVSLGLLSGTVDDLFKSDAYRDYYMHGTSHWLGLDVHDVGTYTIKAKPRPLERLVGRAIDAAPCAIQHLPALLGAAIAGLAVLGQHTLHESAPPMPQYQMGCLQGTTAARRIIQCRQ